MIKEYTITGITDTWLHQPGMMVYVETEYNKSVNIVIKRYYKEISEWCKEHGLIFLYIPEFYKFGNSQWLHYLIGKKPWEIPVESTSIVLKHSLSESSFLQIKGPSLVFTNNNDDNVLSYLIDEVNEFTIEDSIEDILSNYQKNIVSSIESELFVDGLDRLRTLIRSNRMGDRIKAIDKEEQCNTRFRVTPKKHVSESLDSEKSGENEKCKNSFALKISNWINCILDDGRDEKVLKEDDEKVLDEDDEIDTRLKQQALDTLLELFKRGYTKETILAMFAPMEEVSPIRITKDYRIELTLYHKEIELPPIQKAIYLLFLKHPEGIYFKELFDYENELYRIYRKLAIRGVNSKHIESIKDLVNPLSNSINEKCSNIKKRILAILDESLAKHYYISGGKGELKRIDIKPSLIIWECPEW